MPVETLVVGKLNTDCYLFYEERFRHAFIIDPGDDSEYIINRIRDLDLKPQAILATHGHFDHILAVTALKLAFGIPFYLHIKDEKILERTQKTAKFYIGLKVDPPPKVDYWLKQGQKLISANLTLKVLAAPGHTQGGVSFYSEKENLVFVGDTLFDHGVHGRTDLTGGNLKKIKQSIKKILSLPEKTIIYPGHGKITTVKNEKIFY